jgi:hypothetical protein
VADALAEPEAKEPVPVAAVVAAALVAAEDLTVGVPEAATERDDSLSDRQRSNLVLKLRYLRRFVEGVRTTGNFKSLGNLR